MVRMDRAFAAVAGVIALVRPGLLRRRRHTPHTHHIPHTTQPHTRAAPLRAADLGHTAAQGLASGLVNGGPVQGGTMKQIEAQSGRRSP